MTLYWHDRVLDAWPMPSESTHIHTIRDVPRISSCEALLHG